MITDSVNGASQTGTLPSEERNSMGIIHLVVDVKWIKGFNLKPQIRKMAEEIVLLRTLDKKGLHEQNPKDSVTGPKNQEMG